MLTFKLNGNFSSTMFAIKALCVCAYSQLVKWVSKVFQKL